MKIEECRPLRVKSASDALQEDFPMQAVLAIAKVLKEQRSCVYLLVSTK